MHRLPCVQRRYDDCKLGREGHCSECPHRGQHDARWILCQRVRSAAASVEHGFPHDQVPSDLADILWPESEREWIEREGCWIERARYWSSIHTQRLIRELLRDLYDARSPGSPGTL